MRSMFFEQNRRCAQKEILRGSSIIWVRRSRKTESSSASSSASRFQTARRALDVALRISVEHVLHQLGRQFVHVPEADEGARQTRFGADRHRPFGDILGKVADPFEIARDADRADDLAQIDRHRLAPRDGQNGLLLDLALQGVEARIGGDDLLGQNKIDMFSASIASITIFSAMPPISAMRRSSFVEFLVVGSDGMFAHQTAPSAKAAGDVILRALVARRGENLLVWSNSTSSPRYMKAVNCDTRAACCMLCVTIAIV